MLIISYSFAAAVDIAFFPREAGVTRALRAIGWSSIIAGWLAGMLGKEECSDSLV